MMYNGICWLLLIKLSQIENLKFNIISFTLVYNTGEKFNVYDWRFQLTVNGENLWIEGRIQSNVEI